MTKYYSVAEAAKQLDLNYNTALRLIQDGKLLAIRMGGRWRIKEEEVARFKRDGNFNSILSEEVQATDE